nr:MAG TPA: hypothetical protein [Caudoviricetes sp.]
MCAAAQVRKSSEERSTMKVVLFLCSQAVRLRPRPRGY